MHRFLDRSFYRFLGRFVCHLPGHSVCRLLHSSEGRPLHHTVYRRLRRSLSRLLPCSLSPTLPLLVPPPRPRHVPSSEALTRSALLLLGLCLLGCSGRTSLLRRVFPSRLRWPPWYGVLTRLGKGTRAPRVLPPPSGTSRLMEIRHIHHRLTEVPSVDMLIEAWNGSIYRWHGVSLWCSFLRIPQLHAPPVPEVRQSSSE